MASIGAPLSMKLSSKPSRRLSISFDSVRNPDRDLFARRDRDTLANELAEIFSLIEISELANGRRVIQRMGWELDAANLYKFRPAFELILHELQETDQNRRSAAAEVLCIFMLGLSTTEQRSEEETLHEGTKISQHLIRLGLLSDIIRCLCSSVSSMAKLPQTENNAQASESFYACSREIRLCCNILLISMILLPNELHVKEMLSLNLFDKKHIIVFCLDMVSCNHADLFPLKKALMMIRHALLCFDCGINSSDFGESYLKKVKSRRRDVFQISKHIAEHFGPILCIPNSAHLNGIELVTFSRTPIALKQQIETARNAVHIGYSDADDILSEGIDQAPNQKRHDRCEMLYHMLHPRLREYVVGILKVFLSIAPNVRPSAQLLNGFRELQISATVPDLSNSIERGRHTEILTKNISFIILSLLKTFRKGHPLQFCTLLCLLQDKNSLVLILKFLNQNLSASLFKRNEVLALSLFKNDLLALDQSKVLESIAAAKVALNERCWRKYSAYLNMLRILQKITKNSPRQIRSLVKFRAPEILIRLLDIQQSDIIIYTLKLLKSQVAFTDGRWRAENVDIISAIFLHIRSDLFDNWLEPKQSSDAVLEMENSLARSIRQRCHIFNSQRHSEDSQHPLYRLADNASEAEILEAALAEHPQSFSQQFKKDWRSWLKQEQLTSLNIAEVHDHLYRCLVSAYRHPGWSDQWSYVVVASAEIRSIH